MKILQINATFGLGSTGKIVKDIASTVEKNGGTAYVAYQETNEKIKNGYRVGGTFGWKMHALHARIFGKQGYASKLATKKLLKWIDKIKPDVVHLHNLHSNYIHFNTLCSYLENKDIPTVITLHDCWYFTGKCTHFVSAKCNKWQDGCGNCPQLKNEQPSLFFDTTATVLKDRITHLNNIHNLTVVGCSRWIENQLKKSKLKPKKTYVVYNGVDTKIFTPHANEFRRQHHIKEDAFLIMGMADKWCAVENKDFVKRIIDSYKDDTIVIVGCNEKQKDAMKSFNNVIALGYIKDKKNLADVYASADVFVNLTHADTLPTVNMESISSGTPVITFHCCGSPELVDEDSGFVVEENDVEGLIEKINEIKVKGLSFDVFEKQKKFDKDVCYQAYVDIYKESVSK